MNDLGSRSPGSRKAKTINPETLRPYTISMVERLMNDIHFAVDPHSNSKKQVCKMEPGLYRECDSLVRKMQGRLEILAVSVHAEGDTSMDHYEEHDDMALQIHKPLLPTETETTDLTDTDNELSKKMQNQEMGSTRNIKQGGEETKKGIKCSTCNTFFGEATQYREHCKSDWHKHNLKRSPMKLRLTVPIQKFPSLLEYPLLRQLKHFISRALDEVTSFS